jgi:NhaP-type Na+/H+ or K+/H+ antiporter
MLQPIAAERGFSFADPYVIGLLFCALRGVGSLYYVAVAVGAGALSAADAEVIAWTSIACVIVSIVVHGVPATSLSRRWLPPEAR